MLSGESNARGPVHNPRLPRSKYRLTCRSLENWESVLADVLVEEPRVGKFEFMRDLKHAMTENSSSRIFLASELSANQMAVLSQRARDLGVLDAHQMAIINCSVQADIAADAKQQRAHLQELNKAIKAAASGVGGGAMTARKVIVEMLDVTAPLGNAIVGSVGALSSNGLALSIYTATTIGNGMGGTRGGGGGGGFGVSSGAMLAHPSSSLSSFAAPADTTSSFSPSSSASLSHGHAHSPTPLSSNSQHRLGGAYNRKGGGEGAAGGRTTLVVSSAWGSPTFGQVCLPKGEKYKRF